MANITTYLENRLLEHALGKTDFTSPTETYVALFTSSPAVDDTGTEVLSGNGYTRSSAISWGAATGGQIANTEALSWTASGVGWGPTSVKAVGIYDTSVYGAGNLLFYGPLSATIVMAAGDTFNIPVGQLTITIK